MLASLGQAFTLPGPGQLLAIIVVGLPPVLLGAAAYRQTSGASW